MFFRRYADAPLRGFLIWDKVHFGLGIGIRPQHELIAVIEKGRPVYANRGIPSVIRFKRIRSKEHPHCKPADLMHYLVHNFSSPDDLVLDPFAGSGSTAVAAKTLGRRFIGIEIDARYAHLARARIRAGA